MLLRMAADDQAPATKADVRFITEKLTEVLDGQDELKRHFDVTVETIRHDLTGANADKLETLNQDVVRIKKHLGLKPA